MKDLESLVCESYDMVGQQLHAEQREDYEAQVRDRHAVLDELDMQIATLGMMVESPQKALAQEIVRKCSELVGTVALSWPEGA
jgi:hypothetical protein